MANITVVSTTNSITVDFGDYSSAYGYSKGCWNKTSVVNMRMAADGSHVTIHTVEDQAWTLAYSASGQSMIVDSVNAVAPTSNSDLYTKLIALIA